MANRLPVKGKQASTAAGKGVWFYVDLHIDHTVISRYWTEQCNK